MISALDHTTVLVRDLDAGVAAYREIFAREPAFRTKSDGAESVFFPLDNVTLRITAPQGEGSFWQFRCMPHLKKTEKVCGVSLLAWIASSGRTAD
jgi:catechol 2,3-dioxygenase-like lactoylglutathione lyase family enzyme